MKNNNYIWFLILYFITNFFTSCIIMINNGECPELYYSLGMTSVVIPHLIFYLIFHRKKNYYRHFTNLKLNKSHFIIKQQPWFLDDDLAPNVIEKKEN